MPNYNLNTDRILSLTNRKGLNFSLPREGSGNTTGEFILLCQNCQLEFNFTSIKSCSFSNNGNFLILTPTNTSDLNNNYILWNGYTEQTGQQMEKWNLKEIMIGGPLKDRLSDSIPVARSIQIYMNFFNSTNPNLLITISVICQANLVGASAITNAYALLNKLAPLIPLKDETKQLGGLSNFNLGNLLPQNKSYFVTLMIANRLQFIIMTNVLDIPPDFLTNFISRVMGSQGRYESLVNNYQNNIPNNPPGTIIYFNQNIPVFGSDQAIRCNSNCQQVPANIATPGIGSTSSATAPGAPPPGERPPPTVPGQVSEEVCETVEVEPGAASTTEGKSALKEVTPAADNTILNSVIVTLIIFSMILLVWWITRYFLRYGGGGTNIQRFLSAFGKQNWLVILFWILGVATIVICFILASAFFVENNKKTDENSKQINVLIPVIVGVVVYIISFGVVIYKMPNVEGETSWFNGMKDLGFGTIPSPFSGLTGTPTSPGGPGLPRTTGLSGISGIFGGPAVSSTPALTIPSLQSNQLKLASNFQKLAEQVAQNPNYLKTPEAQNKYKRILKTYSSLSASQQKNIQKEIGPVLSDPFAQNIKALTKKPGVTGPSGQVLGPGISPQEAARILGDSYNKFVKLSTIKPEVKKAIQKLYEADKSYALSKGIPVNANLEKAVTTLPDSGPITPEQLNLLLKIATKNYLK